MDRATLDRLKARGYIFDQRYEELADMQTKFNLEREQAKKEKFEKEQKKISDNNVKATDVNNDNNKIKREIYLTFDDGPEAGTEEILNLLKEKEVKGTFFLIGKRVESQYKRNKERCFSILKDIYENHSIGNHSYSHANEYYSSFYREGGVVIKKVGNVKERRTVVDDFAKAKNTFLYYLELANGVSNPSLSYEMATPLSKNQKVGLLRFPGTNTWYIKGKLIDIKCTDRGNLTDACVKDTEEEAKILGKNYNIFGWDTEWNIDEPKSSNLIRESIIKKVDNDTIQYDNTDDTDPFFNLYSKEYIVYDRPIESVKDMRDELLDLVYYSKNEPFDEKSKFDGKVVLLMHDRLFRRGKIKNNDVDKTDKTYLKKLGELIDYFKSIKAEFKTLDEY